MGVIRWGILGCGDVTEVKSGPGFQKARGSELVAVMRRDGEKAKDYARRHGVARWYDDADKLIGDEGVDAVYVATPPGTHELYAMKVLAAGKPCYVEKPMARCASEAKRMVEGFQKAGVPLFVAYYRRALPRFLKAKEIIETGRLGKVQAAQWVYRDSRGAENHLDMAGRAPWRFVAENAGGGLFLDMGSHALDMLDFWLGPLRVRDPKAANIAGIYEVEDMVEGRFSWPAGTEGMFSCDFRGGREDLFVVGGARGLLRMSCFGNEPIRLLDEKGGEELFDLPNPVHVQLPLIQTVVDELLGVGKCPSTGESGLRTQEVMDATLERYYGGREDGFWGRKRLGG